jgi:hypothetical protein
MTEISAEVFDSESKGARAFGRIRGSQFVVLTGSYAVGDGQVQPSLSEKPGRLTLRENLKASGRLVQDGHRYRFTQDTEFNSPSEAASIIWGSNLNGRLVFGIDEKPQTSHVLYFQIDSPRAIEGYKKDGQLHVAARDRALAEQRKEQDNHTCQSCGFRLSVQGRFVIECHHLEPVALGVRETALADLVSLCPTCHRIAHMREPIYAVEEIRKLRCG